MLLRLSDKWWAPPNQKVLFRELFAETTRMYRISTQTKKVLVFLNALDGVLGLLREETKDLSQDVERLIAERNAARAAKNWERADEIRRELLQKGIVLEDSSSGTVWKSKL